MSPQPVTFVYYFIPALLLLVVFIDLKTLKIPHPVIWITLLAGIATSILSFGFLSGLIFSFSGLLVEFLFFFILYLIGPMGAGDVKLAAALGTFLGPKNALFAAVNTILSGGLIAIFYLIVLLCIRNFHPARRKLPFSPAIACGTLLALWPPNFIHPIKTALGQ